MKLYDQHLHSRHSFDSQADPVANVKEAVEVGLAGLTFTEHFDVHPEDWKTCTYDDKAYSETIAGLRDQFGGEIFIGKGIEICFQPDHMAFILDFLAAHQFDMVMLSIHYFAGLPVHRRKSWGGIDVGEGTRKYLETVLEGVRMCRRVNKADVRVFDVLGHLDFVKRYTQRFFSEVDVKAHGELLDEILSTCLEADVVPEINTTTLRGDLDETMPGPGVVKRYAALGGTAMSLGSDSHKSEHIGADFDFAVGMLRDSGIKHMALFNARQRTNEPIE